MPLGLKQLALDGENTNEINSIQSKKSIDLNSITPFSGGFFMSEIILTIEPNNSHPLKSIPPGQ